MLRRIGRAIVVARERAQLTQEEAASLAEIDSKRWQRLERGVVNPTVRTLLRAARACGMDLFALLAIEEIPEPASLRARSGRPRAERVRKKPARSRAKSHR